MKAKTKAFYNAVVDVDLFYTIYDYLRFNPGCAKDYNIFSTVDFDNLTFEDWKYLAKDAISWLVHRQLPNVYIMCNEERAPSADTWGTLYYQTLNYMMIKDSNIRKAMRSMTLDEIKDIENNHILTLNRYYDAIKDIFQDGDIIVGYSLGCIYALLIAEKLEKTKQINKCILIDGTLKFVKEKKSEKEDMDDFEDIDEELYEYVIERYSDEFKDKLIEIYYLNSYRDFHTPQIMSYILYLSTSNSFNEDLDNISDNYEFIYVDSTHENIIDKDVNKIKKYFK